MEQYIIFVNNNYNNIQNYTEYLNYIKKNINWVNSYDYNILMYLITHTDKINENFVKFLININKDLITYKNEQYMSFMPIDFLIDKYIKNEYKHKNILELFEILLPADIEFQQIENLLLIDIIAYPNFDFELYITILHKILLKFNLLKISESNGENIFHLIASNFTLTNYSNIFIYVYNIFVEKHTEYIKSYLTHVNKLYETPIYLLFLLNNLNSSKIINTIKNHLSDDDFSLCIILLLENQCYLPVKFIMSNYKFNINYKLGKKNVLHYALSQSDYLLIEFLLKNNVVIEQYNLEFIYVMNDFEINKLFKIYRNKFKKNVEKIMNKLSHSKNLYKWEVICKDLSKHDTQTLINIINDTDIKLQENKSYSKRELCKILAEYFENENKLQKQMLSSCSNTSTISGDLIEDIPSPFLYTIKEFDAVYCFNILELIELINNNSTLNPFTRNPLPTGDIIEFFKKLSKNIMENKLDLNNIIDTITYTPLLSRKNIVKLKAINIISKLRYPRSIDYLLSLSDSQLHNFITILQINNDFDISYYDIIRYKRFNNKLDIFLTIILEKFENDPQNIKKMLFEQVYNNFDNLIEQESEISYDSENDSS